MRLAAIAVPEATGAFTENGNRIGAITVDGSVALIAFAGLFVGLISGVLWVTVERWIPGGTGVRALLAMPVAVALGSFVLIKGTNVDFLVLQHQPVVIGLLLGLVMLAGASTALVDAWLDRHLPQANARTPMPAGIYAVVTLIGLLLGGLVIVAYLGSENRVAGFALLAVGVATLATWALRLRRRDDIPTVVAVLGYGGLAVAVALGLLATWSEVSLALLLELTISPGRRPAAPRRAGARSRA